MKKSTLLVLAAAGVAVALLMTTKKGKEIRKTVADNADEWKDSWTKFAGSTGTRLTHLMDSLAHELNGMTTDAREKVLALLGNRTHNGQHIKN